MEKKEFIDLQNLMESFHLDLETAMDTLKIPEDARNKYRSELITTSK